MGLLCREAVGYAQELGSQTLPPVGMGSQVAHYVTVELPCELEGKEALLADFDLLVGCFEVKARTNPHAAWL